MKVVSLTKVRRGEPVEGNSSYRHFVSSDDLKAAGTSHAERQGKKPLNDAHVLRFGGTNTTYQKRQGLGGGGFATCYVGINNLHGPVAVKRIRLTPYAGVKSKPQEMTQPEIEREYQLAKQFGGPAAPITSLACTPTKAYVVTPLMQGNATEAWTNLKPVGVAYTLARIIHDTCAGLQTLHTAGWSHNDVKAGNLLVHRPEGESDLKFVLSDFGLSAEQGNANASPNLWNGAPEHILRGLVTPKADVYSLGIMCLDFLTGTHPFASVWPDVPALFDATDEAREEVFRGLAAAADGSTAMPAFTQLWATVDGALPPSMALLLRRMIAFSQDDRIDVPNVQRELCAVLDTHDETRSKWQRACAVYTPKAVTSATKLSRIVRDILHKNGRVGPVYT